MATIREVVTTLTERDGVQGVIVLGTDGLTIDAVTKDGVESDNLSAMVPEIVQACNRLSGETGQGGFASSVIEFGQGKLIVAELTAEAMLAVIVNGDTNIGPLLYELKRHQPAIAQLL